MTVFAVDRADGGLRRTGTPFAAPAAVCVLPLGSRRGWSERESPVVR